MYNKIKKWCWLGLCNAFGHSTPEERLILLKCNIDDALLSLMINNNDNDNNNNNNKKINKTMENIINSSSFQNDKKQQKQIKHHTIDTQTYVSKLQHVLKQQPDQRLVNNVKKIIDIIQSGVIQ